jgi:hypothetical protein
MILLVVTLLLVACACCYRTAYDTWHTSAVSDCYGVEGTERAADKA